MIEYKFKEDILLEELKEYIDKTYSQHYAKGEGLQTFELIAKEAQRGLHFATSNCMKYSDRCQSKGSTKADLLKVAHYAILALYCWDRMEDKRNVVDNLTTSIKVDTSDVHEILRRLEAERNGPRSGVILGPDLSTYFMQNWEITS